jgi:hypothetical protein
VFEAEKTQPTGRLADALMWLFTPDNRGSDFFSLLTRRIHRGVAYDAPLELARQRLDDIASLPSAVRATVIKTVAAMIGEYAPDDRKALLLDLLERVPGLDEPHREAVMQELRDARAGVPQHHRVEVDRRIPDLPAA